MWESGPRMEQKGRSDTQSPDAVVVAWRRAAVVSEAGI